MLEVEELRKALWRGAFDVAWLRLWPYETIGRTSRMTDLT
jgi:hypothetical protein